MVGKKKISIMILVIAVLIIGTVWAGFPIFWMIDNSFKPNADIFSNPPIWFSDKFSAEAYLKIFNNPEEIRFFINSYGVFLPI